MSRARANTPYFARSGRHARSAATGRSRVWYLLLLVPIAATLWVPLFNRDAPAFFGIPYFYWYLLAWVPLSAICSAFVYLQTRDRH